MARRRPNTAPRGSRGSRWRNSGPPTLPVTLITRPVLHDRLTAGASQRLTVQLVLAGRYDPPLWQHRLRMSGQLNEIRDRDLYCSLTESHDLLANFGVQISVLTWR